MSYLENINNFCIDWQYWIISYVILHVLLYIIMTQKMGKYHLKHAKNEIINEKYAPFVRRDTQYWSMILNFPFYITFIPRMIMFQLTLLIAVIYVQIVMIGINPQKDEVSKIRLLLIKYPGKIICRFIALVNGLVWIKIEYMTDFSYKQWLGPDWKPEWTGASTVCGNHTSFLDVLIGAYFWFPKAVAAKENFKIMFLGKLLTACKAVSIDRTGTKEDKLKALKAIEESQIEIEQNGGSPIGIFPEGATTNGEQLLQFKRGAFMGLKSIQPFGLKYWTPNGISVQNDTMGLCHFFYASMAPFSTVHVKLYPVFKPNDYFWQNFQVEGKSQLDIYIKTIREDIIAKSFDFKLSELSMENKYEFKDAMKGKNIEKKHK